MHRRPAYGRKPTRSPGNWPTTGATPSEGALHIGKSGIDSPTTGASSGRVRPLPGEVARNRAKLPDAAGRRRRVPPGSRGASSVAGAQVPVARLEAGPIGGTDAGADFGGARCVRRRRRAHRRLRRTPCRRNPWDRWSRRVAAPCGVVATHVGSCGVALRSICGEAAVDPGSTCARCGGADPGSIWGHSEVKHIPNIHKETALDPPPGYQPPRIRSLASCYGEYTDSRQNLCQEW